jgi:hypothetical protein
MRPFIRRALEAMFAACFGIVGGLGASAFLRRGSGSSDRREAPARPAPISIVYGPAAGVDPSPRSSPLANAREQIQEPQPSPPSSAPAISKDPDEEMREANEFHGRQHEAALRAHHDEPRDAKWASSTEGMLAADLAGVRDKGKFAVVGVDCRMTSCVTVLEWSSYDEALHGYGATLREPFHVNCGQEILLPPPPNPAAPYQASMVFDCEGWRAAGN